MTHLQEHWEGASLSGGYTLEQWLGGDDSAAFFRAARAQGGAGAVVKLAPEGSDGGDAALALWRRTRQLRHPNLVELLEYGRADHRGEAALYAVFESPDETLADALSRSPLNQREAREVLDSVLDALRYLHGQGLVLGALDAKDIVAVGEQIKISTEGLREAETASAYREDIRLLGDLWQRHLMPASPKSSQLAAHAADPNPETRWTLAEISAALNPPLPIAPPSTPPAVHAPVSSPPVASSSVRVIPAITHDEAPEPPPSRRLSPEPGTAFRFPKWIIVGAAGIVLLILGLNLTRHDGGSAQSRTATVAPPVEAPAAASKSEAPRVAVATRPRPSTAADKEMWRVIAFTYRTRDAAAKKARQLNEHHPGLNAVVFSPKDTRGYYLVSLGGRMTREEAERLQRSARGKGLPRDLYVQNYSE